MLKKIIFLFFINYSMSFANIIQNDQKPFFSSDEIVFNKKLLTELRAMVKEDQQIRFKIINSKVIQEEDSLSIEHIDQHNFSKLQKIIETYGWPGYNLVGEEGSNIMWLLIQHQDNHLEFQKKCLVLLKKAVDNNNASFINYAYLIDRIFINEGKEQIYGTQWKIIEGNLSLQPVKDYDHLDERRKQAGLSTIEEYKRNMIETYQLK